MKINRGDSIFFAVLAGVVICVFGSSLFFKSLILDDVIYVGRFHLLSFSLNNLKLWWEPVLGLWGPLAGYSFMLDHLIWGKEHLFFGAHLVNILLHFAAAAGFYAGARILKFPRIAAGIAVLFWCIHPQRAESVAWLSERKDVLILAFGVWSIVFFMQSLKAHKKGLYALSVLFFALSFCIKPALIGLPVILSAYLWGRYRRTDWRFYVKYSGIFWLLSLIYYVVFKCVAPAGDLMGTEGLFNQMILIGWRYGSYLVKTFVPYGLNPMYPHFSFADDSLVPLYAAGVIVLLLLEFLRRKNRKTLYLYLPLFLSFSAAVAPGLLKIGDTDFADRYSYFPSVFAVLAAAALLCSFCRRFPRMVRGVTAVSCCAVLGMGIMCFDKVFVWETPENYLAAIFSVPRPNYRVVIGSAIRDFDNGDFAAALQKADRLRQDYNDAPAIRKTMIGLFTESLEGAILYRQGRSHAGAQKLLRVFSHSHWSLLGNAGYQYARTVLLMTSGYCQKTGRRKEAAELYRRAAGLYGRYEPMEREFYLALSALCLGDKTTALRHFENAQQYSPDDVNIRKNIEILKKHVR